MSRTRRKQKALGSEFWASRLHRHGETPGRFTKTLTHRLERRTGKSDVRDNPQEAAKRLAV